MGKSLMFNARSRMPAPATELFSWHAREGAFERLQPPWDSVEVLERTGEGIHEGARIAVRLRVGGVPVTWKARHTRYIEGSLFQDAQEAGPFSKWIHTHRMWPEPPASSVLEDDVEYALPGGPLGQAFGGGMVRERLETMFAYRHAVTREDLRRHAAFAAQGPLTVAVSGASGLMGGVLRPFLTTGGHRVRRLVRGPADAARGEVSWRPEAGEVDLAGLEGVDAVVHLSGAPIAGHRWTPEYKETLRQSRVQSTRVLCEALARLERRPRVLVSASAIGFYGDRGDELLTEASAPGDDFLASVCREWEAATRPAEDAGIRVVRLRFGVVLDAREGALAKMLPAFSLGAGGRIGTGQQWMSWVSLEDVLGLLHFSLFHPGMRGAVNAVAPGAVRQEEFARTLGRVLARPSFMPLPAVAVRTAMGELGEALLLSGAHVKPEAALAQGFSFLHPELEAALRFTLGRTTQGPVFQHG
ncbi:TIGR01777 family oxidoreductase [Myxococcaceae bacterium GXIMD 01537]